jgi:hypothetical protein
VHWNWWKFTVRLIDGHVLVRLNDQVMLQYDDPEPLTRGHVGFWSVRNGFAISRVSSSAERMDVEPHILYVREDAPSCWQPVLKDGVLLSAGPGPGLTRVTQQVGAGFFAVRHTPPQPVDLRTRPIFELPLSVEDGTRVAVHFFIGGQSFILDVGKAPLNGIKSFLTPQYERGECFRLPAFSEQELRRNSSLGQVDIEDGLVRIDLLAALGKLGAFSGGRQPLLEMVALGNTSNSDYLLAGSAGNAAGASYAVGVPRFLARR